MQQLESVKLHYNVLDRFILLITFIFSYTSNNISGIKTKPIARTTIASNARNTWPGVWKHFTVPSLNHYNKEIKIRIENDFKLP